MNKLCQCCNKLKPVKNSVYCALCKSYIKKKEINDKLPKKRCICSPVCNVMIPIKTINGNDSLYAKNHRPKAILSSFFINGDKKAGDYIKVYSPTHIFKDDRNCVLKHRLIVEIYYSILYNQVIYLDPRIHIHHINGDTKDNRLENLEILTRSQNMRIHYKGNKYSKKDFTNRICNLCKGKPKINSRGHEMWYNDINGYLCDYCHAHISRLRKRLKIS
jgi:hypothetical protein